MRGFQRLIILLLVFYFFCTLYLLSYIRSSEEIFSFDGESATNRLKDCVHLRTSLHHDYDDSLKLLCCVRTPTSVYETDIPKFTVLSVSSAEEHTTGRK